MPTFYFTLSQTDIVAARNNTIVDVSMADITPTPESYFLVSFWNGATKISESYLLGTVGYAKLLASPILQSYSEALTILPTTISAANMPNLLLTAKASYHNVIAGVDTVYTATDILFNLVLALVPNLYFRSAVKPDFDNFYSNYLESRYLTYKSDSELLTATEPSGVSFLAGASGISRETWATYINFRAEYFIVYDDFSSETKYYTMPIVPFGTIRSVHVSFPIVESIKTYPEKIISFKIRILANDGVLDVGVSDFRTFKLDPRHYEFERTFCFLNSLGGWEYFSSHGYRKVSSTAKKEKFTSFSDLSSAKRVNMDQVINIDSRQKAVIDTGIYDRKKIAVMQEIIESPLVYLVRVDPYGNRDYIAINILTEKLASFNDDDYLDSFSFEYEFNHTETSTQDFLI